MIIIETMKPGEVSSVRQLLVAGLAERWGIYEPSFNPDLETFPESYSQSHVLVAKLDRTVVGVGILVPTAAKSAQIVRMSVAGTHRKQGIGRLILTNLLTLAQKLGYDDITLETTSSWSSAIALYQSHGFRITHVQDNDTYFYLHLNEA